MGEFQPVLVLVGEKTIGGFGKPFSTTLLLRSLLNIFTSVFLPLDLLGSPSLLLEFIFSTPSALFSLRLELNPVASVVPVLQGSSPFESPYTTHCLVSAPLINCSSGFCSFWTRLFSFHCTKFPIRHSLVTPLAYWTILGGLKALQHL
jgi:hypothetical protein